MELLNVEKIRPKKVWPQFSRNWPMQLQRKLAGERAPSPSINCKNYWNFESSNSSYEAKKWISVLGVWPPNRRITFFNPRIFFWSRIFGNFQNVYRVGVPFDLQFFLKIVSRFSDLWGFKSFDGYFFSTANKTANFDGIATIFSPCGEGVPLLHNSYSI